MKKVLAVTLIMIMAVAMTEVPAFAFNEDAKADVTLSAPELAEAMEREEGGEPEQDGEGTEQATGGSEDPSATDPTGQTESSQQSEPVDPITIAPQVKVIKKGPGLAAKWKKVDGADYYQVFRSYKKGKRGRKLAKVKGRTNYKDKKVRSGKKAYYTVRAHIRSRGFTPYSKQVPGKIFRVYIETGHGIDSAGRWDPGCTWGGYQEAKLMIPICKSMAKYLRKKGVYVYTDAFKGNNRNLTWLLRHLKGYDVSVLVNVHCDSSQAAGGTLPLYRYSEQKKLAKALNKCVHQKVHIRDRGLERRTDLETLNKTKSYCTACLFETGNIQKDNHTLRTKYKAYGKGLAMGVCRYLGVEW